jgi:hypothetical protein
VVYLILKPILFFSRIQPIFLKKVDSIWHLP